MFPLSIDAPNMLSMMCACHAPCLERHCLHLASRPLHKSVVPLRFEVMHCIENEDRAGVSSVHDEVDEVVL
jgi:hypothetical protein